MRCCFVIQIPMFARKMVQFVNVCRKSGLLTTILLFYCWSCCIDTILSTARPQIPPHINSSFHDARACRGFIWTWTCIEVNPCPPIICMIAKSLFCADSCSLNAHPKSATWDMGSLLDCQPVFPLVCTYSCPYLTSCLDHIWWMGTLSYISNARVQHKCWRKQWLCIILCAIDLRILSKSQGPGTSPARFKFKNAKWNPGFDRMTKILSCQSEVLTGGPRISSTQQ